MSDLKQQYPDCILMFHVPGSYLFLHDDVKSAADVIGITAESEARGSRRAGTMMCCRHCAGLATAWLCAKRLNLK